MHSENEECTQALLETVLVRGRDCIGVRAELCEVSRQADGVSGRVHRAQREC
eukprot:jgi/Antlo1/1689/336